VTARPKLLIIGNMGYVGPVVVKHLRKRYPAATLLGFDLGLFAHCISTKGFLPEGQLNAQHFGDVRQFPIELLEGIHAVVYLAAISNDPMGREFEALTDKINRKACVEIAHAAKNAGVKNFVFASSCSVYGAAGTGARTERDPVNPLTAYARSKINAEEGLASLGSQEFGVTCLRFATACGMSSRLRLDLVLNDFVASAIVNKTIQILSDGSPWRPLIHVEDMARAIEWASFRSVSNGGAFIVVNTGSTNWNYQIIELAKTVASIIGNTDVQVNANAVPDQRSYQVNFDLFRELAPDFQPKVSLNEAVIGLQKGLLDWGFNDANFRESSWIRLRVLRKAEAEGLVKAEGI
jgi:nucleoside-diphosphate-sugar epimerase